MYSVIYLFSYAKMIHDAPPQRISSREEMGGTLATKEPSDAMYIDLGTFCKGIVDKLTSPAVYHRMCPHSCARFAHSSDAWHT